MAAEAERAAWLGLLLVVSGIIDVVWKDENEVWAVGGGGSMFVSRDGGKTFTFNKSADDIPGNLYKVGPSTPGLRMPAAAPEASMD